MSTTRKKDQPMSITKAVAYAAQKGVPISDRALRKAIKTGRLLADWTGSSYVTTESKMDIFLLHRRRKITRKDT